MSLLWFVGALSLLLWSIPTVVWFRAMRSLKSLSSVEAEGPEPLPSLTVVVPARNEEPTVEAAMRSLLAVDYPELEIIAINDRSTDKTGEILDRLAASGSPLRVIHISELPPGWLGKNHALHVAGAAAGGEYILFTDADVHFEPSALRRALRHAARHRVDHLVMSPQIEVRGFWEPLNIIFFTMLFGLVFRPYKVADPRSKAFIGIGAFNLVRAEFYRRVGGHSTLSMDVLDDVKLGKLAKRSGGLQHFMFSGPLVRVRWVEGLRGLINSLNKNSFANLDYQLPRALFAATGLLAIGFLPILGLMAGPAGARLLFAASFAMMGIAGWLYRPRKDLAFGYGFLFPLSAAILAFIILRSTWTALRQGGVFWRGTFYPLDELRRGLA